MELLILPLVGSIAAMMLKSKWSKVLSLLIALLQLALTGYFITQFNANGSYNFITNIAWFAGAGINFKLGIDGMSMLLLLLTNLSIPLILYATNDRNYSQNGSYYALVLLMQMALNGVFMALDGMVFYIFWELALIPIYFICATWGDNDRIRITLKFFIYTFSGSLLMLAALIYLYLQTPGLHSFDIAQLTQVALNPSHASLVVAAFFLAFAIKIPIFPFHTWQPDTYVSAPTGGSMLLSGIMLKMGLYGLIRWMIPCALSGFRDLQYLFMVMAITGIIYASIIAIKRSNIKRVIAYSSIAHVGLIAAGIFAYNKIAYQGALIQMFNHGINVLGLFFIADILQRRTGTLDIRKMGGIALSAPVFATLFMIVMLGAVAIPLTNGFIGEFLLLKGIYEFGFWYAMVAGLTIILGAVYMLRVYQLVMFGKAKESTAHFKDLDTRETIILGFIALAILVIGVYPQFLLNLTEQSVNTYLNFSIAQ